MLIRTDTRRPWKGEALRGLRHPLSIDDLWSDAELAAVGLVRARPPVIPAGQRPVPGAEPAYDADGQATVATEPIPVRTREEIEDEDVAALLGNPMARRLFLFLIHKDRARDGLEPITAAQLAARVKALSE